MKPILRRAFFVPVAIIVVGISSFVWLGLRLRDAEPDPNTAVGRQRLQVTANSAQPLLDALKSYRNDYSHYPVTLAVLYPHYLKTLVQSPGGIWEGWYYFVDPTASAPQEYSLSRKVGTDPLLRYTISNLERDGIMTLAMEGTL